MIKLAIFDRDGTINALAPDEDFVTSPEQWQPIAGALQAMASLSRAGWRVVLATHQPGLGRGLFDVTTLNAIHALMHKQLAAVGGRIDAVFYCPHTVDDACLCRKPAPGLLEQICDRYHLDPRSVPLISGCALQLQAGAALGMALHWVGSPETAPALPHGTQCHADLAALAAQLLAPAASV